MNRLTKKQRGNGVCGTRSPATGAATRKTSAPAATIASKTSAPVLGISATQSLPVGVVPVSHASSVRASPIGGWWPTASPNEGLYPHGGFTNFLHSNPFANHPNGTNIPENFHFVGAATNKSSMSPIDLGATRTPPTHETVDLVDDAAADVVDDATDDAVDDVDAEETEASNINENFRTNRRLNWSVDEDKRLANAWLRNSKDPIEGNSKKSERYWQDVTDTYNKNTENNRKRNQNQLKIRWDRVEKPLSDFHGYWVNAQRVWQSGMSDDQVIDKASELWAGSHNGKAFGLLHMWKVVRGEQKWAAYLARFKKDQEKEKSAKANTNPSVLLNLNLDGEKRPMGNKKAKKERNGKRKATDALSDFSEKFEKSIEASNRNREEREKMTEVQQNLADKRIEAAKLGHEAAYEQTKCKMLETYTQLLLAPTDQLSADALVERKLALESMRLALFPK